MPHPPEWTFFYSSPHSLSTAREPAHNAAANEKSVRPCASNGETFRQLAHHTGARRLCKNDRTQNNQLFATRAYATINRAPSSRRSVPNARPCAKPHNDLGTCNAQWPRGPHSRVPARLRDAHGCKQTKSWTHTKRRCVPTWQMRFVATFRWCMASHPSTPTPVPCGQTIPMSDAAKRPGKTAEQKMSAGRNIKNESKTLGTNPGHSALA